MKAIAVLMGAILSVGLSLPAGSRAAPKTAFDHRQLQAALDAAQVAASRPGDDALGCDALERELVTSSQDPALQAFILRSGADAGKDIDAVNAARSRAPAQAALTIFGSVVPGGAWAGHGIGAAQTQAQQAQAVQTIQQRMQQTQDLLAVMPQMMRGQRVIELAQARDCAWMRGAAKR